MLYIFLYSYQKNRAFGCILYALATGKPPFESQNVQETLLKIK
jgi:serine/threonine protein kinase